MFQINYLQNQKKKRTAQKEKCQNQNKKICKKYVQKKISKAFKINLQFYYLSLDAWIKTEDSKIGNDRK